MGSLISLLLGEDELKALFLGNSNIQNSIVPRDLFSVNLSEILSVEGKIQFLLNEKSKFIEIRKFLKETINKIDLALSKLKKDNEQNEIL